MKYYLYTELEKYDENIVENYLQQIPSSQRKRIEKVKHFQGRREKIIAWQLLIQALKEFGIDKTPQIAYTTQGKPYLINHPNIHFNISHCKTTIAVAINQNSPIGIDVESRRKISDALIKKVCNEQEQNLIKNSEDPTLTFIKIWTRKEAYYKCIGTGIQDDLHATENLAKEYHLKIETYPLPDNNGYVSICY